MKPNHQKHKTNHANKTHTSNRTLSVEEIDRVVAAFDAATRSRLPDGVMGGVLRNHEAEIRQEAILIQLKWFLDYHQGIDAGGARKQRNRHHCWNFPKAAAHALKYAKLRHIDRLEAECGNQEPLTEANGGVCGHDSDCPLWRLPKAVRRAMALCGIRHAEHRGLISTDNADVASLILEAGMSVGGIAAQRGVTRGAIYQQLSRLRVVMPAVMAEIEVPTFGLG